MRLANAEEACEKELKARLERVQEVMNQVAVAGKKIYHDPLHLPLSFAKYTEAMTHLIQIDQE